MINDKMITIKITSGGEKAVPYGTPLFDVAQEFKDVCGHDILIANVNNELQELGKKLIGDSEIEFYDFTNPQGFRVYQRSVSFIMIYAAKAVLGEKTRVVIEHSLNKNYYCEIPEDGVKITSELLQKIEDKMRETVSSDFAIEKLSVPVEESVELAEQFGLYDKVKIMRYRRTANVNLYKLDWFYDYFYGPMANNTARTPYFKLKKEGAGFMLCFPAIKDGAIYVGHDSGGFKKITGVFNESGKWARILKADTVGALNDIISDGEIGRFIMTNEALHEKSIARIADKIHEKKKTIVLIAGPSSSGKTTFAERLSVQLRVNGLRPNVISLDNYYKNRSEIPAGEDGKPNLESVEALDVDLINENCLTLLKGETAVIPRFDFMTGKRDAAGKRICLKENDVLIIEGIHGLNDALTSRIPEDAKFKIFISAMTQLNIDDHNRIPTSDTRLIRRIVRDNQFRDHDARKTIAMWPSVTRGEDEFIFPYQEKADSFFNSALVYEMCVLKQYVEPLLFKIQKSNAEYAVARRLVKFLDCFLGVSSEEAPKNSILREFIGGSCFKT